MFVFKENISTLIFLFRFTPCWFTIAFHCKCNREAQLLFTFAFHFIVFTFASCSLRTTGTFAFLLLPLPPLL